MIDIIKEKPFIGFVITLVIGTITELDIFFIPLIRNKSDFEKKTKRNDSVTIEIIVKFFAKVEILKTFILNFGAILIINQRQIHHLIWIFLQVLVQYP